MSLRIAAEASLSDVGRQRSSNEDSFLESAPLFAVADGMGGARAGEVASQIAVEMLAAEAADAAGSAEERLEQVAQAANRRIFQLAQDDESRSGMGTTLTAAIVDDGQISVAHVGDSRLYRFRDETLERLTRDHSLVEELVRRGELDPDDVESHPQRAIITRALGPAPAVEVETFSAPGRAGDVYLLCSDGLTTMVKEDRIADTLRSRSSLEDAARRLINTANENGGRDNITVVLFELGETDADVDDQYATRADLRVEDVEDALAAESAAAPLAEQDPLLPTRPAPPRRRRRLRTTVTVFFVLLSIALLIGGFYIGSRQFYFLDTNSQGRLALYRGVPLTPLGVPLFELESTSTVPAGSLPPRQRAVVLDKRLRPHGDAVDLLATLEQQRERELSEAAAERRRRAAEARERRRQGSGGDEPPSSGGSGN